MGYASPNGWNRNITVTISSEKCYEDAFVCQYSFSDEKDELMFNQEIRALLEKSTVGYIKSRLGNTIVYIFIFLLCFGIIVPPASEHMIGWCALSAIMAQIVAALFNNLIWKRLFPMVSFSWGEAVSYYSSLAKWKEGVFWSIIIAIPVSIVASCLYKVLFP